MSKVAEDFILPISRKYKILQKILKQGQKGFTLIEVMIVVAIIGILAGIAIPNFIAYRDKAYCKAAESDANNLGSAIADYYADPTHLNMITTADLTATRTGANTATISGTLNLIVVTVTDGSGQCPQLYMQNQADWNNVTSVFSKTIQ